MFQSSRAKGDNKATQISMYKCRVCADDKPHAGGLTTVDRHMDQWHNMTLYTVTRDPGNLATDVLLMSVPPSAVFVPPDKGRE